MEKNKDGFLSRMRRPLNQPLAKKPAGRFRGKAAENYFRFLTEPEVELANNGSEQKYPLLIR
jgi:hypothetical protein